MAASFYYGGQAVIEGVMMRGRRSVVTAVRRPSGDVVTQSEPLSWFYTGKLREAPLIRGVIVLLEAMLLGIKTLLFSANVSLESEKEPISGRTVGILLVLSLGIVVSLFFLAPLLLTRFLDAYLHLSPLFFNMVEGLVRLAIFAGYLKLITLMPDTRRILAYHGAEHKAVNAYEDGAPLEVPAIRKYSTTHIRCGTSFLFAVMTIAILVFSLIGRPALYLMVLSRAALIPLIAALGYEVTYFGGRHARNPLVRLVLFPGLLLERLTTKEPDDSQIEVAATALKQVIALDESSGG